MKTKIYGVLGI